MLARRRMDGGDLWPAAEGRSEKGVGQTKHNSKVILVWIGTQRPIKDEGKIFCLYLYWTLQTMQKCKDPT